MQSPRQATRKPLASKESPGKAVASSMAANIAAMSMAAAASILAARLLGPQGRGQFAAIMVWATLAAALGDLGISQSCSYHSARQPAEAGRIVATAVALSVAAAAVLVLLLRFFGDSIFGEAASAAKTYLLAVPVSMAVTCLGTTMLGMGHFGQFNLIKTIQAAGHVAGISGAWIAGSVRVDGLLRGILFSQALGALVALACASRIIPLSGWHFHTATAKRLLSYGIRTYAGNLCWLANGRLDQALLAWLAPMRELGIYAVAVSYSQFQFGVSGAIATVAFSRAARAGSSEARSGELWRGLHLFALIVLPLAAVMALCARRAIATVYGAAFDTAGLPACVLLFAGLFLGANYVSSNCLRADGRPGAPVWAEAAGLVVTVAALPFVIPRWGIRGAAWASVASYAATAVILAALWRARKNQAPPEAI